MKKVELISTTKLIRGFYILLILLLGTMGSFAQNMGINATGAPPNANAGLDVDFGDKGVLIPRVALTGTANPDPLAAHVAGMIVYNTATVADVSPGFYYDNGTRWIASLPAGNATGDMLYWDGMAWVRIPAGSTGQFLQFSNSSVPTWVGAAFATLTTDAATNITGISATSGGNITSDGGSTILSRGICYSTNPNPTTADNVVTSGSGTGAFTANMFGLSPVTTYYVRAYATNSSVTSYGNEISFTTLPVLPSLGATTAVTNVTGVTATSGGNVTSDGGGAIIERGICYGTASNITILNSTTVIDPSPGIGIFSSDMTGLLPTTLYYVRSYATNSAGTAYGTLISFRTKALVVTTPPSDITGATVTSGGEVTFNGTSTVFAYGLAYSTSPNSPTPTWVAAGSYPNPSPYSFVKTIAGLASNTTYYVRAYATSNGYTNVTTAAYGDEYTFTTTAPSEPVMATTTAISNITSTTASSGGQITSDGGSAILAKGVCWDTSPSPVLGVTNFTDNGTGIGAFGSSITGLTGNTTYYVRSYATNIIGTGYGPELSFTTCMISAYNVGDLAGGGKVFYVDCNGGGLIAALTDQSTSVTWGCYGTAIGTPATLGTGAANTAAILSGCAERPIAASVASDYTGGGFTDWYLPSAQELYQMMLQHTILGIGGQYWSSTDNGSAYYANIYYYINNIQASSATKTYSIKVRAIRSFGPPALASVTTDDATNIAGASATSGGNVTSDGGATVSARGVCWSTATGPTIADSHTSDGTGTGTFTSSLTGLTTSTTYFVRAYATNVLGTVYGNEVSFTTTAPTAPTVTTDPVSNPTESSCTSGGNVTSDGGDAVTAYGVCWSTTSPPTTADSFTTDGSGTGTFVSSITGLTAGLTYYIRAYATNGVGTSYGNEEIYTPIPAGFPTVTTDNVYNLVGALAETGGTIVSDGGNAIIEEGVCWDITANPTIASNTAIDPYLFGAGTYYANITGLTVGTTYHYRAYATNSAGTSYGDDLTFVATAASIGQIVQGGYMYGIVYYIDGSGQHGLMADAWGSWGTSDWGCTDTYAGASGTAIGDGFANTAAIISDIAANSCVSTNGFGDFAAPMCQWDGVEFYLPSKDEFDIMWTNRVAAGLDGLMAGQEPFWSSSEVNTSTTTPVWYFDGTTWQNTGLKTDFYTVWAVASF